MFLTELRVILRTGSGSINCAFVTCSDRVCSFPYWSLCPEIQTSEILFVPLSLHRVFRQFQTIFELQRLKSSAFNTTWLFENICINFHVGCYFSNIPSHASILWASTPSSVLYPLGSLVNWCQSFIYGRDNQFHAFRLQNNNCNNFWSMQETNHREH